MARYLLCRPLQQRRNGSRRLGPIYGLTASIFTSDINRALRLGKVLKAGKLWVNRRGRTANMMTSLFGGSGAFGFEKRGLQSFENFIRQKWLLIDIGL